MITAQQLINSPKMVWDIATSDDLIFYQKPDHGTARRTYCLFEDYVATKGHWPNGLPKHIEIATNILPLKYIEQAFRRIVGIPLAAGLYVTVVPIGYGLKFARGEE